MTFPSFPFSLLTRTALSIVWKATPSDRSVHWIHLFVISTTAVALFGCTPNSSDQPKQSVSNHSQVPANDGSQASSSASQVHPHPEFAHWTKFEPGTTVRRKKTVSNDQGTVVVHTQLRLAAKDAQQVTVETQISVDRSDSGREDNPPFEVSYPATFALPASMKYEQFQLPSLKAKQIGQEEVECAGQKVAAKKFEWTESNESGPMQVAYWQSDTVPGRFVKQEQSTSSIGVRSHEIVVAIELK